MNLAREKRIKEENVEREKLDQIYKEKIENAEQEKLTQFEVATKLEEGEERRFREAREQEETIHPETEKDEEKNEEKNEEKEEDKKEN